ncbi:hypothetical protein SZ00_06222 (plasmid) [Rhodococcus sp. AD45]|nr:hypothetical protein SZ00_06154 [Rhodococcus sp. AD45]KJF19295.1 hypothetical protein SZ00_06222 [Rhodococcus sp. AD45]
MPGGGELCDVGPDLGEDRLGGVFADAGDRGQQFDLAAIRFHEFVDAGVDT